MLKGVTGWENGKFLVRSHELKFTRYKDRQHVFKGRVISVTESLSLKRMEHLKKVKEQHGFATLDGNWTLDGKIMFKENDSNSKVYYS